MVAKPIINVKTGKPVTKEEVSERFKPMTEAQSYIMKMHEPK